MRDRLTKLPAKNKIRDKDFIYGFNASKYSLTMESGA